MKCHQYQALPVKDILQFYIHLQQDGCFKNIFSSHLSVLLILNRINRMLCNTVKADNIIKIPFLFYSTLKEIKLLLMVLN